MVCSAWIELKTEISKKKEEVIVRLVHFCVCAKYINSEFVFILFLFFFLILTVSNIFILKKINFTSFRKYYEKYLKTAHIHLLILFYFLLYYHIRFNGKIKITKWDSFKIYTYVILELFILLISYQLEYLKLFQAVWSNFRGERKKRHGLVFFHIQRSIAKRSKN